MLGKEHLRLWIAALESPISGASGVDPEGQPGLVKLERSSGLAWQQNPGEARPLPPQAWARVADLSGDPKWERSSQPCRSGMRRTSELGSQGEALLQPQVTM